MAFLRLSARWDQSTVPIYEAAARGKYVPLLKTVLTTYCRNECAYCAFRVCLRCPRTRWEPENFTVTAYYDGNEISIVNIFDFGYGDSGASEVY